jgi:hypothetical protein
MDKAVGVRRADSLFVKTLGIQHTAFDAGDLRTDERRTVREILRASRRPDLELSVVRGQCPDMLLPLAGRLGLAGCCSGERTVKVIFRAFEKRRRCLLQLLRPQ